MIKGKKALFWITLTVGAVLVLLLAVVIIAPKLIDMEKLEEKVCEELSSRLGGEVRLENCRLLFFPRPGLVLEQVEASLSGRNSAQVDLLRIYPRILPLISGQIRLAEVQLQEPRVKLSLPLFGGKSLKSIPVPPFPPRIPKEQADQALTLLSKEAPGLVVEVENGTLSLFHQEEPVFDFHHVNGQVQLPGDMARASLSCESDWWEELSLEVGIDRRDMDTQGRIQMTGLHGAPLINRFFPVFGGRLEGGQLNLDLVFRSKDLEEYQGELEGFIPSLVLKEGSKDLGVKEIRLKGTFQGREGISKLTMQELSLGSPSLLVSGELTADHLASTVSLNLGARSVDVQSIRKMAVFLAGKENGIDKVFEIIRGGRARLVSFHSEAESPAGLINPENIFLRASLTEGKIYVPKADLHLEGVQGQTVWSQGILEVEDIEAGAGELLQYGRLPSPLKVSGGSFSYDGKEITVRRLTGSLGSSSFKGINASLTLERNPRLKLVLETSEISTEELYPWLSSFRDLKDALQGIRSLKGRLVLTDLRVKGPLRSPEKWDFELEGKAYNLALNSTWLSDTLKIANADFQAVPGRLSLNGTTINTLDASLTLSGELVTSGEGLSTTGLTIQGEMGSRTIRKIWEISSLPPDLMPRAPLEISGARMVWRRGGPSSLSGDFKVKDSYGVSLYLLSSPRHLRIKKMRIRGKNSSASLSLDLSDTWLEFSFQGKLDKAMVDGVLIRNTFLTGRIEGDFTAKAGPERPSQLLARGTLRATGLHASVKPGLPITIHQVSLTGEKKGINVNQARIKYGDIHLTLEGNAHMSENGLSIDMDILTDTLDWESLDTILGKRSSQTAIPISQYTSFFPLRGRLELKVDAFTYGKFTWSPLEATVFLRPQGTSIEVTQADLCGISMPGTVEILPNRFLVQCKPFSKTQDLEDTVECLWDKKGLIKGRFGLQGRLAGEGKNRNLVRSLRGELHFHASNGRIYRLDILAKIFALLNVTEIYRGELPDLAGEGFAYRTIKAEAIVGNGKMAISNGLIDGASMEIVFEGEIDLMDQSVDITALVAPLKTVDFLIKHLPVVNALLGGNLISIPVKVKGDLENPKVVPLSPSAVGSSLLNFLERTLKLPFKVVQPLVPGKEEQ